MSVQNLMQKLHFFNLLEANTEMKINRRSLAKTLEVTEVLIGMTGLPFDSHSYTELWGNHNYLRGCVYVPFINKTLKNALQGLNLNKKKA